MTGSSAGLDSPSVRAAKRRELVYRLLGLGGIVAITLMTAALRVNVLDWDADSGWLGYQFSFSVLDLQTLAVLAAIGAYTVYSRNGDLEALLEGKDTIPLRPRAEDADESVDDEVVVRDTTRGDIVRMVDELAERVGIERVRRVVLLDEAVPQAMSGRILGRGAVVAITKNMLQIMPPRGVRAVIAHEIGHIVRRDPLRLLLTAVPLRLLTLVAIVPAARLGGGLLLSGGLVEFFERLMAIVVVVGAVGLALAKAASWVTEAVTNLPGELTGEVGMGLLNRFPPDAISPEQVAEDAPRLYVEAHLHWLSDQLKLPLDDVEIRDLARRAAAELTADPDSSDGDGSDPDADPAPDDSDGGRVHAAWRDFDTDGDGHLDRAEIAAFVADLRDAPERMLSRQYLCAASGSDSHPPIRERVLFLHRSFLEGGGS